MFREVATWLGIAPPVAVLILATLVWGLGFLWLRASLPGERDIRSFRATSPRPPSIESRLGMIGIFLAIGVIILSLGGH
jgi:hypothetical protein